MVTCFDVFVMVLILAYFLFRCQAPVPREGFEPTLYGF